MEGVRGRTAEPPKERLKNSFVLSQRRRITVSHSEKENCTLYAERELALAGHPSMACWHCCGVAGWREEGEGWRERE